MILLRVLFASNHGDIFNPKEGADIRIYNLVREITKYEDVYILQSDRYIRNINKKFSSTSAYYFKEFFIFGNPLSPFLDFNPSFILRFLYLLSREKIDLVQISFPFGILIGRLLIKIMKKDVILIYDSHNVERNIIKNIFLGDSNIFLKIFLYLYVTILEGLAVQIVDHIITVSAEDRDIFLNLYDIDPNKISIITTGATIKSLPKDGNRTIAKKKLGINDGKKTVLFHGTFSYLPNKQATDLILKYIAPEIKKRFNDAIFIIAGNGMPKFKKDNLFSLGFVEDLELLLQAADIAIVPILIGGGTRIKILDYMGSGIPVLSTEKGIEGISAENNKCAIIVKNVDDTFINSLELLLTNEELRQNIGYNGYKFVKEQFEWTNIGVKLDSLYKELIQNKRDQNYNNI